MQDHDPLQTFPRLHNIVSDSETIVRKSAGTGKTWQNPGDIGSITLKPLTAPHNEPEFGQPRPKHNTTVRYAGGLPVQRAPMQDHERTSCNLGSATIASHTMQAKDLLGKIANRAAPTHEAFGRLTCAASTALVLLLVEAGKISHNSRNGLHADCVAKQTGRNHAQP